MKVEFNRREFVSSLAAVPLAATAAFARQAAKPNFFEQILHYMYEGDTALHIAAAAYQIRIAEELIARGADVRARNRRGAGRTRPDPSRRGCSSTRPGLC